jgi:predicted  nucleic acid-binding Zn-ribbon protein
VAFKLTKHDAARRAEHVEKLTEAAAKLEDAVVVFNAGLEQLKGPLTAALAEYNSVLAEARGFAEDIASQADSELDEKSERWRDSDRGQAAVAFKDEWEGLALDELELELPDEARLPDEDHAAVLEGAPTEAESE